ERHSSSGVLVDTNILLLYFVGSFNREQIPRFKRTNQFAVDDYDLLVRLLSRFARVVTTPNILSEVNSLSGQMGEPAKTEYFQEFARGIATLDEQYVASAAASQRSEFPKLGLTDSGILHLAGGKYLVLTDDFKLCQFLERAGVDVLNFNHIRLIAWT
ncbi:MAG: PIN domain-containing protein, partial [Planctomycetota bacterium]